MSKRQLNLNVPNFYRARFRIKKVIIERWITLELQRLILRGISLEKTGRYNIFFSIKMSEKGILSTLEKKSLICVLTPDKFGSIISYIDLLLSLFNAKES